MKMMVDLLLGLEFYAYAESILGGGQFYNRNIRAPHDGSKFEGVVSGRELPLPASVGDFIKFSADNGVVFPHWAHALGRCRSQPAVDRLVAKHLLHDFLAMADRHSSESISFARSARFMEKKDYLMRLANLDGERHKPVILKNLIKSLIKGDWQ